MKLGAAIRVAIFGQMRSVPIFAVEPASYFAVYREDLDVDPDALKAFIQQNL